MLSKIYDRYVAVFGGDVDSVIAHLRQHAEPVLAARHAGVSAVADYRYDWSLNDVPR